MESKPPSDTLLDNFAKVVSEVEKQHLNGPFVKPALQRLFQERGYHLLKDHFYSPVPRLDERNPGDDGSPVFHECLDLDDGSAMDAFFFRILRHASHLREIPRDYAEDFYWNNSLFPPLDAMVYYGIVSELRPRRIVEIGCGFSTEIALRAASTLNDIRMECIEPFPHERFKRLVPKLAEFRGVPVQDVPLQYFSGLERGDVLFIDTSHVVKRGSEVIYLLFKVLPRLKPGVVVHIHDIFLPYEYPAFWLQDIGIMWNEQYLVLALLMNRARYRVKLLNFFLSQRHEERLAQEFAHFNIWNLTENLGGARGASLWFEVH